VPKKDKKKEKKEKKEKKRKKNAQHKALTEREDDPLLCVM
jgi:hypothetical protein